jgi:hypothetical protein
LNDVTGARGFNVHIRGDGVAALACARLLENADLGVTLERATRPRVPALLLSAPAMHLLGDIFERRDLFSNLHRIQTRRVAWGPGADAVAVPHAGVVVAEEALLALLPAPSETTAPPSFAIHTVKPLPSGATHHRFGAQKASGVRATLKTTADASSCYVESLAAGWLFLIPVNDSDAWMLAVGASAEDLLAASRLIAPAVDRIEAAAGAFETSPSIAAPVCAPDWLACGSAAMTFDPICGDGTANAAREAILASAVLSAMAKGGDAHHLLEHYEGLLIGAMRRHLSLCHEFYQSGGTGPWWTEQTGLLQRGHEWCTSRLALIPEPRYRLQDFDLVPLDT